MSSAKVTVEHRPFRLPSGDLSNPKLTASKMLGEGRCRLCSKTGPLTRHHLVPESWFLRQPLALKLVRNAHANIVPLCRKCHDHVESRHPVVKEWARRKLRPLLTQQEVAFCIQVRGRGWLEATYPAD